MKAEISLSTLIRLLDDEAPNMSRLRMEKIVERVFITEQEMERYGRFRDDRYSRNSVYGSEKFEIFLMCWKTGQRSLIHDHGGSLGGVKILRGLLTESLFEPAPNGMIKAVSSSDYQTSDIQIEEPTTIHQVSNLQPGMNHAISIHIYVPCLQQMNIYSLYDRGLRSVPAQLYNFGLGI
jgi:cysteine dioxygenase